MNPTNETIPLGACRYTGSVTDYDSASRRHKVDYDDGDVQLLSLSAERVQVLGGAGEQARCAGGGQGPEARLAV